MARHAVCRAISFMDQFRLQANATERVSDRKIVQASGQVHAERSPVLPSCPSRGGDQRLQALPQDPQRTSESWLQTHRSSDAIVLRIVRAPAQDAGAAPAGSAPWYTSLLITDYALLDVPGTLGGTTICENLIKGQPESGFTKPDASLPRAGKHPSQRGVFISNKKLRAGPVAKKKSRSRAWLMGGTMNRLRILLIGAALATGGSALASAQVLQQDVAYREHDRDHDRDRDRDRDRRYDRDHDRDDRRFFDRDRDRRFERRYDYDRRFGRGERRWDGRRWQYWNGYGWVY